MTQLTTQPVTRTPAASDRTILIIDDSEDDIAFLTSALRQTRRLLNIIAETDPADGVRVARRCEPDLIFIDYRMPGMTGCEVVRALRADRSHDHRPLVVLSSSTDPETVARIYRERANAFYDKPQTHTGYRDLAQMVTTHWFDAARLAQQRTVTPAA